MARKKGSDGLIIIKKYANRRLYDTSTSSYVTLDALSEMVRKGQDFEVRDAKTGEDLTRPVLTQIIFEQETKGEGALPLNFLRKLISFYGRGAQNYLPAWLDMSMNSFADGQKEWRKSSNPLSIFEQATRRNMEMFEGAMKVFMPTLKKEKPSAAKTAMNGAMDMQAQALNMMQAQMDAMQAQIAAISDND